MIKLLCSIKNYINLQILLNLHPLKNHHQLLMKHHHHHHNGLYTRAYHQSSKLKLQKKDL